MKAYRIAVPEKDGHPTYPRDEITRQEIHVLIKAYAEKLGWDWDTWYYESSIIELDQFGDIWFYNTNVDTVKTNIKNVKGIEISWQDFLKLTPEDVIIKPELTQEEIDILTFKHPTTTDHNKQALLEAFTAGWDAVHNNRFSIGVNFDKWYHEKAGEK